MKPCKKLFVALSVMVMVMLSAAEVRSSTGRSDQSNCLTSENTRRANLTPRSLKRSRPVYPPMTCGQNALCGTLDGTFDWVYGQVGIYYRNTDLGRPVFVPLYVKEAAFSDDGYLIPYMIPKWDGKVFWMNINPDKPPLWIQPYYLDNDPSCAGCMKFISRGIMYKQKDKDYSDYPYGAALMFMYVNVNADFTVRSYTIDVYDQDDKLPDSGQDLQLNIGDQVQTFYVEDDENDSPDWNFVSLEDPVLITQKPKIEYAGYIPGRDIGCSNCGGKIDLPQTDLFFRFAGYHVVNGVFEKIIPKYSDIKEEDSEGKLKYSLGNLRNNVCAAYPNLTTKEPTLADIIEGLRILASLAPQHFCFRDVNADNKFDMAEVIWMLQKIAGLR